MSQHDLSIANQGFPAFRSDLNNALQALGSMQSGTSEPATTYANMLWYDTTNNIVKMRNEDNDAWISLITLNQTNDIVAEFVATSFIPSGSTVPTNGLYLPAANSVGIATNSTNAVYINSSQNVGIGTSSPNKKLEVLSAGEIIRATSTTGANDQLISVKNDSGTANCSTNIFFADRYAASSYASSYIRGTASGTSALIFATGGTNFTNIYDAGAPTERMRIDSSGNVGIGTASPSARLHVYSTSAETLRFQSTSSAPYQTFYNSSANRAGYIEWNTSALKIDAESGASSTISFLTANNERARIDSSGNLLVGTTSTLGTAKVTIKTPDGSGSQIPLTLAVGIVSDGFGGVSFRNPNGAQGGITINSTTVSYNTTSDYRLKENVQPMIGALATVAQLKPCTYIWKANGSAGQGFIAHELQAVVPDCVTGEKDAIDEEGKPQYQGIDTSFLVATLTAAIKEQQALIEQLTTRIAALEAK